MYVFINVSCKAFKRQIHNQKRKFIILGVDSSFFSHLWFLSKDDKIRLEVEYNISVNFLDAMNFQVSKFVSVVLY